MAAKLLLIINKTKIIPKQQNKDIKITFQEIAGSWKDVTGDSGTLADYLQILGIIVDDKTKFARFRDYENERTIIYRAYGGRITLQICQWD